MDDLATDLEHVLDDVVDSTPTVDVFLPNDLIAQSLISDLATGMNKNHVIAARYGLDMGQLYAFVANPEVRRRIKAKKAIWHSDANLPERNRVYYGNVALEAAPVLDRLLHNPTTPPGQVIRALEVVGRLGGVDFKPPSQEVQGGGGGGAQFSVVIQFSGGRVENLNLAEPKTIEGETVT